MWFRQGQWDRVGLGEDGSVTPTGLNARLGFCLLEKGGRVKRCLLFQKLGVEPGPRTSGPPWASCSGCAPSSSLYDEGAAAPTRRCRDTQGLCGQSLRERPQELGPHLRSAGPRRPPLVLSATGRRRGRFPVLVSPTSRRSELTPLGLFRVWGPEGHFKDRGGTHRACSHTWPMRSTGHAGGMAAWEAQAQPQMRAL